MLVLTPRCLLVMLTFVENIMLVRKGNHHQNTEEKLFVGQKKEEKWQFKETGRCYMRPGGGGGGGGVDINVYTAG